MTTMTGLDLRELVVGTCAQLADHAEEIGDLDAILGDGDLGITLRSGCQAVVTALRELPDPVTPSAVLSGAAMAFASANPSTMAALVGRALRAASVAVAEMPTVGPPDALRILEVATAEIQLRGGAELGDKTIVDAMAPAVQELKAQLAQNPDGPLDRTQLVDVVTSAVESNAALQSQRGRASWQGERSKGQIDPGSRLFQRLIESIP